MAPNKFEKHIKKELENREIQPSANAWEKLSEKLDATAPQSKKRNYLWYGIAASFIGLLILSVVYFSSESSVNSPDVQIVDTPKNTNETISDDTKLEEKMPENEMVKAVKGSREKNDKKAKESFLAPEVNERLVLGDKNTVGEKESSSRNVVSSNQEADLDEIKAVVQYKPNALDQFDGKLKNAEELIDTKVLEILAKVNPSKDGKYDVTSLEVDSLLRKAQEEIFAESAFQNGQFIDATALLVEVEDELDPTFRDRIFMVLESKLLEASASVANRNN